MEDGLHMHRHEAYFVLDGSGLVAVDGWVRPLGPGVAVFIPGVAPHAVRATGERGLRVLYVLAADAFEDVEYVFGE